jgi:peroxisomal membrane protein 4
MIFGMPGVGQEVSSVLKGMRNGLEYGSKVRFVHTLVMTLLFKDVRASHLPALLKTIISMAAEHGLNLGLFVLAYKGSYKALDRLLGPSSFSHFAAGLLFGTLIFGKKSGVNSQIVLYLLSRVLIGLATLGYQWVSQKGGWRLVESGGCYYLLAALCWGTVMWLFEGDRALLQPSLSHSMEFLYKESDNVARWTDLVPYYPKPEQ